MAPESTSLRPTGFVYSPDYLKHRPGPGHPESPRRLEAVARHIRDSNVWSSLQEIEPRRASQNVVQLIHPEAYVDYVAHAYESGRQVLDGGDTLVSEDSYAVALLAAGGVAEGVRLIFERTVQNAFCAVRPPGHHAEIDAAMGFCLFNNAAIAARYAQRMQGADRVLILDWDVHHGNGTQHVFESDSTIFYISLHQYPFYPGTGDRTETGVGPGLGTTKNFPLPAGTGDAEYLDILTNPVFDAVIKFSPDFIIISSGFDAHARDPLANMMVSTEAFGRMTEIMVELAWESCEGRILSILEGGYDLKALGECTEIHLEVLAGSGR